MLRRMSGLSILCLLMACGGGHQQPQSRAGYSNIQRISYSGSSQPFVSGPITTACLKARRKEASRRRCSCVQSVADRHLTYSEQVRGAAFFSNPQMAQDTRQSDHYSDELFWKKWKAYGKDAGRICT